MSDDDDTITGSYVNGCDVDLIGLCRLELSGEQHDALWGRTNAHDLLKLAGAVLEVEMDEDGMPGMSDVYYTAHVDDGFEESLREVILEIIEESDCDNAPDQEVVSQDDVRTSCLDRGSADPEDPEDLFIIGRALYLGDGLLQDYFEAVEFLRRAADQNYAPAQRFLGFAYEQGNGVPQDKAKAVKLYRKSAEEGDTKAQEMLGVMLAAGNGVARDYVEAVKWFRKSAEHGHVEALRCLGVAYENGKGVSEDHVEAAKWYRMAAEKGHPAAQRDLGWMYAAGKGVSQDEGKAVEFFRKAADQGNVRAQFHLGSIYSGNETALKDKVEAYAWLSIAAKNGHECAKEKLEEFITELTPNQLEAGKRRVTELTG